MFSQCVKNNRNNAAVTSSSGIAFKLSTNERHVRSLSASQEKTTIPHFPPWKDEKQS